METDKINRLDPGQLDEVSGGIEPVPYRMLEEMIRNGYLSFITDTIGQMGYTMEEFLPVLKEAYVMV